MGGKEALLNCFVVRGGGFFSMCEESTMSRKCWEEVELLFSFEGYATFEISDTRTFIFINSIDSLLLSLNTGLSI